MAVLTCYETIARYAFRAPVIWAIEVPEFLLTIGTAMALAYTQEVRGHISIGLIESRLPLRPRNILTIVLYPLYLGIVIFLTWSVFRLTITSIVEGRASTTLEIPLVIPLSFIVIGIGILCLQVIVDIAKAIDTIKHKSV